MTSRHAIATLLLIVCACAHAPPLPEAEKGLAMATDRVVERDMTLEDIRRRLWGHEQDKVFRASTLLQRQLVSEILTSLFERAAGRGQDQSAATATGTDTDTDTDKALQQLAGKAARVGLQLEIWRVAGRVFWVLLEPEGQQHGAGAYIVSVDRGSAARGSERRLQVVLQAPHAHYDLGTGELALHMFFREHAPARALFTNSVHRYWNPNGKPSISEDNPADVCHRADHVFQNATETAAQVLGDVAIVQLHGFSDSSRRPDAIVSSGDASGSTPYVAALARALDALGLLGDIKRFPEDTDTLGGTTNAQGRMLRTHRRAVFVHLELSKSARQRLRASPEELTRFGDALYDALLGAPVRGGANP